MANHINGLTMVNRSRSIDVSKRSASRDSRWQFENGLAGSEKLILSIMLRDIGPK